jgi:hypothetical protein
MRVPLMQAHGFDQGYELVTLLQTLIVVGQGVVYREVAEDSGPNLVRSCACWSAPNDNSKFLDLLRKQEGSNSAVGI